MVTIQHQYKKTKINYHYNNNQNVTLLERKQFLKMNYNKMHVKVQYDSSNYTLNKKINYKILFLQVILFQHKSMIDYLRKMEQKEQPKFH